MTNVRLFWYLITDTSKWLAWIATGAIDFSLKL
jgi:hypothetical protein